MQILDETIAFVSGEGFIFSPACTFTPFTRVRVNVSRSSSILVSPVDGKRREEKRTRRSSFASTSVTRESATVKVGMLIPYVLYSDRRYTASGLNDRCTVTTTRQRGGTARLIPAVGPPRNSLELPCSRAFQNSQRGSSRTFVSTKRKAPRLRSFLSSRREPA